eukprot:354846-Pyramimonas_sp.AAC.1
MIGASCACHRCVVVAAPTKDAMRLLNARARWTLAPNMDQLAMNGRRQDDRMITQRPRLRLGSASAGRGQRARKRESATDRAEE